MPVLYSFHKKDQGRGAWVLNVHSLYIHNKCWTEWHIHDCSWCKWMVNESFRAQLTSKRAGLFALIPVQWILNFLGKTSFSSHHNSRLLPPYIFVIRLAFFFFSHTAVGWKIPPLIEMESSTIEQAFVEWVIGAAAHWLRPLEPGDCLAPAARPGFIHRNAGSLASPFIHTNSISFTFCCFCLLLMKITVWEW